VVVTLLEVVPCSEPYNKLFVSCKTEGFMLNGLRGATSLVVPSLETTHFNALEDVIKS